MNCFGLMDTFESETFKDLTCDHAQLSDLTFRSCTFTHCNFTETVFHHCRFLDCEFEECDLSMIKVPDCAVNARFKACKLLGVDWTVAVWGKQGLLNALHFEQCTVNYSTFIGLALPKFTLRGCIARDVDFMEADLHNADFTDTDFDESRFHETNLTGADFSGATNYRIDARINRISKAKFQLPEALTLLHSLDVELSEAR